MKVENNGEAGAESQQQQGGERVVWEYHNVQLTRVPTYGFGIAVSGGRDNPHFRNGDPSVAISEVLKAGPAEGKLEVNDRLISANGISLENVDYARAVQILRDSGQTVHLVVKRRIVLPATPEPQTLKVTLTKNKKKDDFGIVLGCRVYVKEIVNRTIADKEGGLEEGDVLLKINNTSTENLSLKDAKKLLEGTKEKLQLVVRRENQLGSAYSPHMSPDLNTKDGRSPDIGDGRHNYSTQNLYVQPPTRGSNDPMKNMSYHDLESKNNLRRPDPRFVSFKKEGSVGIRLTGGNEVGIFVTAVQPKSQAHLQGLIPGDKILKVNDMDMSGVTREEAVLYLMSLQDQIDLIVQTRVNDYQHILSTQKGDLFYIRTHFHYDPSGKSELSFRSGDIFRVVDTLHNGVVGAWQVYRIGRNNQETQKGIIPNKARAEELATAQFNAAKKEQTQSESRSGFFKRRRNSRRSKSLGKDHWEDVVFADSVSKFPAYERVSLRHPGFVRPVVLFGPLADLSREKLLKENSEKYASPQLDSSGEKPSGIIRLSAIREILERGKHAVLDITPNAVDRLNYAQFYPVVIFLRAESKQVVKELRAGVPNATLFIRGRMSSKKLYDQSVKLEKLWSHVFTATISLSQPDSWFRKIMEIIEKQQAGPIWMSEAKPSEALTDDFLFPMTSRLSYASSPESDLETGPESRTPSKSPHRIGSSHSPHGGGGDKDSRSGRLVKSSSDPSIAAQEDGGGPSPPQNGPPPYTASPTRTQNQQPKPESFDDRRKSQGGDSKYGFASSGYYGSEHPHHHHYSPGGGTRPHGIALPVINGRDENGEKEPVGVAPGATQPPQFTQAPPYVGPRNSHPLSLSPNPNSSPRSPHTPHSPQAPHAPHSPHSPHTSNHISQPPYAHPSRSPPKNAINFPPTMGGKLGHPGTSSPAVNLYNGHQNQPNHLGDNPGPPPPIQPPHHQPDLPPKVNRASKPIRLRSSSQDRNSGQDFGGGSGKENDFSDNNYINTGRGSSNLINNNNNANVNNNNNNNCSLERQNKSPYEISGIPIGPNAHDDLKSRLHPRSPQDHYRYNRSSSQPPHYHTEDPYSYSRSDYKPMPPPKSSGNYKPVPPPKPKHYRGGVAGPEGGVGPPQGGGWGYSDSVRKGYDRGSYHTNSNGGLSDDYSGIDSGQGSSLDRKYETLGRTSYSKGPPSSGRTGYYLNVPPPRDNPHHQQHPSRGDLPNHDHRGSAFEFYKKPADPRNPLMPGGHHYAGQMMGGQPGLPNQLPPFLDQGTRCSLIEDGNLKVIATARGVFDHSGGTLTSEQTGVSIIIPPGALVSQQEVYFKVCQDNSLLPPLDQEKGETLLSPLVMCGPHGLKFNKPVELRLPHCASDATNAWSFALKSTESPQGHPTMGGYGQPAQWTNVDLAENEKSNAKISQNSVSVLVDHF